MRLPRPVEERTDFTGAPQKTPQLTHSCELAQVRWYVRGKQDETKVLRASGLLALEVTGCLRLSDHLKTAGSTIIIEDLTSRAIFNEQCTVRISSPQAKVRLMRPALRSRHPLLAFRCDIQTSSQQGAGSRVMISRIVSLCKFTSKPRMALVEWALSDDELLAFLSELDGDDWLLKPAPGTPSPSVSLKTRIRKPRKSRRLDLLNARQEIAELQSQLQLVHEKVAFRESLNASQSSCGLGWQLFALREKILKMRSAEENARLRRRVTMEAKAVRRMLSLVRQQTETVSMSVRIRRNDDTMDLQDEDQVYRVLHACINLRCGRDLDAIVQQCDAESVLSESNLERSQWRKFVLQDRGVGVEFREAVAMPFSTAVIHRAIRKHVVIDSLEECKGNVTHKPIPKHRCPHNMPTGPESDMDRRLILRRIVNLRESSILLWEDASFWQSHAMAVRMLVRTSAWAFVSPALGHEDEISLVYCGGLIQIHATDESPLKPGAAEVKSIVKSMQSLQRSRVSCMEESLLLKLEPNHR